MWSALDQIKIAKTLPDEKRFAVVLISDCMEGGSGRTRDELLDELNKTNVPRFTVMLTEYYDRFVRSAPNSRMEELMKPVERFPHDSALASGGSAYFPRKGGNAKLPLAETLKDLTAELWSQFVLTYTPPNQIRDGNSAQSANRSRGYFRQQQACCEDKGNLRRYAVEVVFLTGVAQPVYRYQRSSETGSISTSDPAVSRPSKTSNKPCSITLRESGTGV